MNYPRTWDTANARAALTTESRQKQRDLFMQTHRPFRAIRVDFSKEQVVSPFIDEEQLRQIVQAGDLHDHNRLFFIVGEPGSGKSELCQWLEYAADRSHCLPIHVPRSATSAAHVAALMRRHLGVGQTPVLGRTPIDIQAAHIAHAAVVILYERSTLEPRDRWEALLLSTAVRQAIREHLELAIHGQPSALLSDDATIAAFCAQFETPIDIASLRNVLADAATQALWLGDVRDMLGQLSSTAARQGQRVLLLLEDVTALQLLGDRLLDYLTDLSAGQIDAVIGVTPGHERTRLASTSLAGDLTHIHQRLRARFALTDDYGRAFGFDEDLTEFVRAYLRAIKGPVPAIRRPFLDDDLYPFTEIALRRALGALREEGNSRQTPRLFIEHVLAPALIGDQLPPLALDNSHYLAKPPALFRSSQGSSPELESVLRWYGHIESEHISLDPAILEVWTIAPPLDFQADQQLRVDRAFIPRTADASPDANWEDQLRELQFWLGQGGRYPSRETLKRGIERVILTLGDPRSLRSPDALSIDHAEIVYARGDERLPIVLGRDSGDQPATAAYIKVQVEGIPIERTLLEELAYLDLSQGTIEDVCQNIALTYSWARAHWDAYHQQIRTLLVDRVGISAEQIIWYSWRLICGLRGAPWSQRPALQIPSSDQPATNLSPWSSVREPETAMAGEALVAWAETVRRLFIGSFTLRETMLDLRRCQPLLDDESPTIIGDLANIPLATLKNLPYKIRPSGQGLYQLLAPLQRYAQSLERIDRSAALHDDLRTIEQCLAHLDAQRGIDPIVLRSELDRLRWRCGELGVAWRERWNEEIAHLQQIDPDQIESLWLQAQALRTQLVERADHTISVWDYQELRCSLQPFLCHPYWQAVAALQQARNDLLRTAHERYRTKTRSISTTALYQRLLRESRKIWEALNND